MKNGVKILYNNPNLVRNHHHNTRSAQIENKYVPGPYYHSIGFRISLCLLGPPRPCDPAINHGLWISHNEELIESNLR